jgi:capsule polysaccharide modification protein KpsS
LSQNAFVRLDVAKSRVRFLLESADVLPSTVNREAVLHGFAQRTPSAFNTFVVAHPRKRGLFPKSAAQRVFAPQSERKFFEALTNHRSMLRQKAAT